MNPVMLIPFIATPMVLCIGTYILMNIGIVGPIVIQVPWTIPPIIGPYLATNGSIEQLFGLLYQLLSHILSICHFSKYWKSSK